MPLYLVSVPFIVSEVTNFKYITGEQSIVRLGNRLIPGKKEADEVTFEAPFQSLSELTETPKWGYCIVDTDNDKYIQIKIADTQINGTLLHVLGLVLNGWHAINVKAQPTDGNLNYEANAPKGPYIPIGAIAVPVPESTNKAAYTVLLKNPANVQGFFEQVVKDIKDKPVHQLMIQKMKDDKILTKRESPLLYTLTDRGKNDVIITFYV